MAVKIRLARRGRKGHALYSIVVADSRSPRDGRFIEKIGTFNPNTKPSTIVLDGDRAFHWLMVGAQPTDTTRGILSKEGVLLRKHLQGGVKKGALTQEVADSKYQAWKDSKGNSVENAENAKKDAKEAQVKSEQEGRVKARKDAEDAKAKVLEEAAKLRAEEAAKKVAAEAAAKEEAAKAEAAATTEEAAPAEEVATEEKKEESND